MANNRKSKQKAPCAEWGGLCGDLQQAILANLSVRDLARAAATCREFREPYAARIEQERASLLAAAEEIYGESLFATFLKVVKRPMRGLRARTVSLVKRADPVLEACKVLISDVEPPRFSTLGLVLEKFRCDDRFGIVHTGHFPGTLLSASLHHRLPQYTHSRQYTHAHVHIFKLGTSPLRLKVDVSQEGVRPTMGLLLAMCSQNPKPTSSRPRRLEIDLGVRGWSADAPRVREAEDLLEILRALLSPAWSLGTMTVVAS